MTVKVYIIVRWILFRSSLPFCLFDCFMCGLSPFVMITNLLMWADARGTRGQQGSDDSAA